MKIICISGSGRSGSTLLSLLLSQSATVFNLGQTRDIWRSYMNNVTCSCDTNLQSCKIWSPVFNRFASDSIQHQLTGMQKLMAAFFSQATTIQNWSDGNELATLVLSHKPFLDNLAQFFNQVCESCGCDTLIDASKSPAFALACSFLSEVDLHVLNLVRDPRAVACSWERRKSEREAIMFTKMWGERQKQLAQWSALLKEKYLMLRYEDFCEEPQASISRLEDWWGMDNPDNVFSSSNHANISWDRQHIYPPGNERLLQNKLTSIDIIRADDWQSPDKQDLHQKVEHILQDQMALYNYQASTRSHSAK
jgi:hypothetical protein